MCLFNGSNSELNFTNWSLISALISVAGDKKTVKKGCMNEMKFFKTADPIHPNYIKMKGCLDITKSEEQDVTDF